jgi:arylsulfatase A-like enzyme
MLTASWRPIGFGIAGVLLALSACTSPEPEQYNVLFIAVDDLRPQLGAYGESYMVTPHLDKLANEGRLFKRHYVQVPTCGASRFSMLTGTRPSSRTHLRNDAFEALLPSVEEDRPESFVHLFRRAGYRTTALGKISHSPDGRLFSYAGEGAGAREMPFSWDEVGLPYEKWETAWNAFFGYADGSNRNENSDRRPFEREAVADTAYPDGLIAQAAIEKLRAMDDQPFFLAVGFFKPHLPFTAPAQYWELYDPDTLPLAPNPDPPEAINPASLHASGEMFGNYRHTEEGGKGTRVSDEYARTLRHAYFASVSYVDAQVGKVLDELDSLGLREKTIVVVWGDHGWHLGDQTLWGKHSTFEQSLRSALLIRTPNMSHPGHATDRLVESVDLYPTLAELAGLDAPDSLAGASLVPLLEDPNAAGRGSAIGYWNGRITLRTDRYRITSYSDGEEPRVELFDYHSDPNETRNLAGDKPEVVQRLLAQLTSLEPSPPD